MNFVDHALSRGLSFLSVGRSRRLGAFYSYEEPLMNKPWVKLPRNLPQYNHFVAGETKINHLTFLADIEKGDYKNAAKMILVRCDCGKELKLRKSEFAKGRAISCGCHRQTKISVGDEIGSWKLLEKSFIVYPGGRKQDAFICECVCGAIRTVDKYSLSTGTSKSCGCEAYKPDPNADTKDPLYNIWNGIMQRCFNPKSENFAKYGGRGITVCEDWQTLKGFASGILALIGPRPSLEHSVDRVPNETGNYQAGQVKWSTRQEQARNRRNASFGIYNGKRMQICEICDLTGLSFNDAKYRYHESNFKEQQDSQVK